MKKRAIILHPAIAPYRVDFFNSLAKEFDASFYFEFDNALEQAFILGFFLVAHRMRLRV